MILCDFPWTGTAAAADNWNKESEENEKFLPEADSTRAEKQRLVGYFITLLLQDNYDVGSNVIYKTVYVCQRFWEQTDAVQTQGPVWRTQVQSGLLGWREEIPWGTHKALQFPKPLFLIHFLRASMLWYDFLNFADSECGPVGFRGFITAFFGCLWTGLSGSSILWGPICSELWHQQREDYSASWVSSGPYGLPLRQVLLRRL